MPFLIPLIPVIAAGVGAATTIAGMVGGHSSGSDQLAQQQKMLADQQAAAKAENDQQQRVNAIQAARQYVPNLQAQLGGAVSPEYYAQAASTQTGYGDQMAAVRSALGQIGLAPSNSPNAGLTPQSSQLSIDPNQILSMYGSNSGGQSLHGA